MHELALCRNIISTIETYAAQCSGQQIQRIYLEIGMLAAVEKTALQFNFSILRKGTLAEQASLAFLDIPGQAFCDSCRMHVSITQYHDPCPHCGNALTTITAGQELRIKSMEVA